MRSIEGFESEKSFIHDKAIGFNVELNQNYFLTATTINYPTISVFNKTFALIYLAIKNMFSDL